MIKAVSLQTFEIDDISLACRELKEQLNEKLPLLKNCVGIVQCTPEFIEAGILEPLHRELNIPLVGGTTVASVTNSAVGGMMLSILVITSDDVDIWVSRTEGFQKNCFEATEKSLKEVMSKTREYPGDPPKLIFAFPPIIDHVPGDDYINAIENICGTIPIFGSLCADYSLAEFDRSAAIFNGMSLRQEMAYVMFSGNINPRFFVATVPKQSNLAESKAVITRAVNNVVYEINNMRAFDYFESIGLVDNGKLKDGIIYFPLLMTPMNNTGMNPFVRALIRVDSDGSAVFRGRMDEGAELVFGSNVGVDVLSSTHDMIKRISTEKDVNAALLFSCIMRQLVIGADSTRELTQVQNTMPAGIPFMASYSGGEIAPASVDSDNNAHNRFHNYSFIICII